MTDHFDGKSLKNRTPQWLSEAFRDAMVKYHDCATVDGRTFPAHAAMWNGIAGEYQTEIQRRVRWQREDR